MPAWLRIRGELRAGQAERILHVRGLHRVRDQVSVEPRQRKRSLPLMLLRSARLWTR